MTLQETFEAIKDERIDRCKKHNLVDILMIVFLGIVCGYKSIEQITTVQDKIMSIAPVENH